MAEKTREELRFDFATEHIKSVGKDLRNEQKLTFYSLFKQATKGDVTGSRPGMFDYAGRAKWDAWATLKGLSSAEARQKYGEALSDVDGSWDKTFDRKCPAPVVRAIPASGDHRGETRNASSPARSSVGGVEELSDDEPSGSASSMSGSFTDVGKMDVPPAHLVQNAFGSGIPRTRLAPVLTPTQSPRSDALSDTPRSESGGSGSGGHRRGASSNGTEVHFKNGTHDDGKKGDSGRGGPLAIVQRWWALYVDALLAAPLVTKALTSGVLSCGEEIVAQAVRGQLKLKRVVLMSTYGLMVAGPMGHVLYQTLDRSLKGVTGTLGGIANLLLVNLAVIPLQTAVYLYSVSRIDGETARQAVARLRATFMPLMLTTWKAFPIIQVLAIKFIPKPLWLPFFNAIGFTFGIYTNLLSSSTPATSV